jgi:hypothetical protein
MRVRLTIHRPVTDLAGKTFQAHPGMEVDFAPEQALRLIQSGQGEAVPEAAEAAVVKTTERAVIPAPAAERPKKKGS